MFQLATPYAAACAAADMQEACEALNPLDASDATIAPSSAGSIDSSGAASPAGVSTPEMPSASADTGAAPAPTGGGPDSREAGVPDSSSCSGMIGTAGVWVVCVLAAVLL